MKRTIQPSRRRRDGAAIITRKIDKAIFEYRMIRPGDRILVGASGGKDSTTLLYHLAKKSHRYSIPFHVTAFHLQTELESPAVGERLQTLCDSLRIPLSIVSIDIHQRLQHGREISCYWCATQRRTEMLAFAEANSFDSIALGHHLEDHVETFFMNLTEKRELSTMLPVMGYRKYRQTVIRPLVWVREAETASFAESLGFKSVRCGCGLDRASSRKSARAIMDSMVENADESVLQNVLEALHHPRPRYLPRRSSGIDDFVGRGWEGIL